MAKSEADCKRVKFRAIPGTETRKARKARVALFCRVSRPGRSRKAVRQRSQALARVAKRLCHDPNILRRSAALRAVCKTKAARRAA
jgi:hypothetical protein